MKRRVNLVTRRAVLAALGERYRNAARPAKARVLDELVAITGYHRKHAIRALERTGQRAALVRAPGRARVYDEAVREALIVVMMQRFAVHEVSVQILKRKPKVLQTCTSPTLDPYALTL